MPESIPVVVFGRGLAVAAVSRDEASASAHCFADARFERGLQARHTDRACAASLVHAASTESRRLLSPHGVLIPQPIDPDTC